MTAPVLPPGQEALRLYLDSLEDRLALQEAPQAPRPAYPMASADLTAGNAAAYVNCIVFVTDLDILAHSNGAHWIREDTGGVIV